MSNLKNRFILFTPATIEKSADGDGEKMIIKGLVSTPREDLDKEILMPSGFQLKPFLDGGFINWNHQAKKDPDAIIGEPIEAKVEGENFLIKAVLYPDRALAVKTYNLQKSLEKNKSKRRLAFSLEGDVLERDPNNNRIVTKALITHVAVTPAPKNLDSYMEIGKSLFFEDDSQSLYKAASCWSQDELSQDAEVGIHDKDGGLASTGAATKVDGTGDNVHNVPDPVIVVAKALIKGKINPALFNEVFYSLDSIPVVKTGKEIKEKLNYRQGVLDTKLEAMYEKLDELEDAAGCEPEGSTYDGDFEVDGLVKVYAGDSIYGTKAYSIGEDGSQMRTPQAQAMIDYNNMAYDYNRNLIDREALRVIAESLDDDSELKLTSREAVRLGF